MGREIKRVPLDFDWPLNKVWEGYLNPYAEGNYTCSTCSGSGYNPETKQLSDDWYDHEGFGTCWHYDYGIDPDGNLAERPPWRIIGETRRWCNRLTQDEVDALHEAGRLTDFTWPLWYRKDDNGQWLVLDRKNRTKLADWKPCEPPSQIPAEVVNRGKEAYFGHDAINAGICIRTRAKRLGVYGHCPKCDGEGSFWISSEAQEAYENWKETEPPEGEGWQVWETVSEGSPITPVFATADALIEYLVKDGYSREAATKFVKETQWTMSAVMTGGKFYRDIEACGV